MRVFLLVISFITKCYFQEIQIYDSFSVNSFDQDGIICFILGWNIVNKYFGATATLYFCGTYQLFGGYQILDLNSVISRQFNLPPHSSLRVHFQFWKQLFHGKRFSTNFKNNGINLRFDQYQIPLANDINLTVNQTCGVSPYGAFTQIIDQSIIHNFENIIFEINAHLFTQDVTSLFIQDFWGINDFALYVTTCPPGCLLCEAGETRQQCISWGLIYPLGKLKQSSDVLMFCDSANCNREKLPSQRSLIPAHTTIQLSLRFKEINTIISDIDLFQIFLHGALIWESSYDTSTARDSSIAINDIFQQIGFALQITMKHSYSFLDLNFYCYKDSNSADAYFDIADIYIYICKFNLLIRMRIWRFADLAMFSLLRRSASNNG